MLAGPLYVQVSCRSEMLVVAIFRLSGDQSPELMVLFGSKVLFHQCLQVSSNSRATEATESWKNLNNAATLIMWGQLGKFWGNGRAKILKKPLLCVNTNGLKQRRNIEFVRILPVIPYHQDDNVFFVDLINDPVIAF